MQINRRRIYDWPYFIRETCELPYINDEPYFEWTLVHRLDNYARAVGFKIKQAPHWPNYVKYICTRGEDFKAVNQSDLSLDHIIHLTGCQFFITWRKTSDGLLKVAKVNNHHNHLFNGKTDELEEQIESKVREELSVMAATIGNFLHPKLIPIASKFYFNLGYKIQDIKEKLKRVFPVIKFSEEQITNLFNMEVFKKSTIRKPELIEEFWRAIAQQKSKHPNIDFKVLKKKRAAGVALIKRSQRKRLSDAIAINTENLPEFTNSWFILIIMAKDEHGNFVPTFIGISLSAHRSRICQMFLFYRELGFTRPFSVITDLNMNVIDAVRIKFGFDWKQGDPRHRIWHDHIIRTTKRKLKNISDFPKYIIKEVMFRLKEWFKATNSNDFYSIMDSLYVSLGEYKLAQDIILDLFNKRDLYLEMFKGLKYKIFKQNFKPEKNFIKLTNLKPSIEEKKVVKTKNKKV